MNIKIKHRYNDAVLFEGDFDCLLSAIYEARRKNSNLCGADLRDADLRDADLRGADLCGADLRDANLCGADLRDADLRDANLCGANLRDANLRGANLRGANLRDATNLKNKLLTTPLFVLREQPGAIRSYKMVDSKLRSPINEKKITYSIGMSCEVTNANMNEQEPCGAGVNLATADWVIKNWQAGYRVLIAEHTAADIAAIPVGSDGKYRVHRCKIVGEKSLVELGIVEADAEVAP